MIKKTTLGNKLYLALIYLFLYAPIFVLIVFSFNDSKSRTLWQGFTLEWYGKLFEDATIMNSLYTTIWIALISSVVATVIGTAAAVGIYAMKRWQRSALLGLNNIPVLSPEIITGISLMLLFILLGFKLGFMTLLLAHISFNIPYVILSVMPKLRQMDAHVYEAAMDLGAPPAKAFFSAVLPQIMPGVVNGFIMALTLSIDDFVISYFTSGSTAQTLPITIFSMTRKRVSPEINALSTILFVVVLSLLLIVNIRQNQAGKTKGKNKGGRY